MAKAVAYFSMEGLNGHIQFSQHSEESPTVIKGSISGKFAAGSKRGIAINVYGDISGANTTGGHFNPYGMQHGAPGDAERMVGSLGNVEFNAEGKAEFTFEDTMVKLIGPRSVIGRSFVLYENEDDGGKGGKQLSLVNGGKGAVKASAVIGIASV